MGFKYEWLPVEIEHGSPYEFPHPISAYMRNRWTGPAVYRWLVYTDVPHNIDKLYIGEAENLTRRIYHYLNPGPSQQTNIRLNKLFREELDAGHHIRLEALQFEPFTVLGIPVSMSELNSKVVRHLLEDMFMLYHMQSGFHVLNA